MRVFIPMTDEMLCQPGGLPGALTPYRAGVACWHALIESPLAAAEAEARCAVVEETPAAPRTSRPAITAPAAQSGNVAASACP